MKHFPLLLGILLLSCGETDNPGTEVIGTGEIRSGTLVTGKPANNDPVTGKVFQIGSATHFTDSCAFYFECDCCSGILAFSPDSTFMAIDYCVTEDSYGSGTWQVQGDTLTLRYRRKHVIRRFNETDDASSAVSYSDTLLEESSFSFRTGYCGSKAILTGIAGEEVALSTSETASQILAKLQADGIAARLSGE